ACRWYCRSVRSDNIYSRVNLERLSQVPKHHGRDQEVAGEQVDIAFLRRGDQRLVEHQLIVAGEAGQEPALAEHIPGDSHPVAGAVERRLKVEALPWRG